MLQQLSLTTAPARFALLELPTEIRDAIFVFALSSSKPVVTFLLDDYQKDSYNEAVQPSLTRVSRQIREDTLPIFYGVNDFIIHSEPPKIGHSKQWLRCIEPNMRLLQRLSFWIRYVTLTNNRSEYNGAICISLQRSKREDVWQVKDGWKWITVVRSPSVLKSDAKFLISELRKMLTEDPNCLQSGEGVVEAITGLQLLYTKEKMS